MTGLGPAIPAATLILLRDRPDGPPDIPMIGRGAHLAFAASRMVFPGGRVDADDLQIAERGDLIVPGPDLSADEIAHRVAAIRETIEEIGLAPSIEGIADVAQIDLLRRALHEGTVFSALLERHGLRVDPHGLHGFARWLPDLPVARRFDTRFYIARAPYIGEARADGTESSHLLWDNAEGHRRDKAMIFPTVCNLERVGLAQNFEEAVALAHRYPIDIITPWIETRDGEDWLCIPDDLGYPVTARLISTVDRGAMRPPRTDPPG